MAAEAALRRGTFVDDAKTAFDRLVDQWGVCCFGSDPRDVQMWAHYGNSQRGVCFQFHIVRSPVPLAEAIRVRYTDDLIAINWVREGHTENALGQSFFTKAKKWEIEGAYRIIDKGRARTPLPFEPQGLVGVVLGCMARRFTGLRVVVLCRRRRSLGMPPVKIYRAVRKTTSLALGIRRDLDLEELARCEPRDNPGKPEDQEMGTGLCKSSRCSASGRQRISATTSATIVADGQCEQVWAAKNDS